ncbi:type II toxin-antitoxin system RelE/ParE family toxin [Azospirillum sp. TSO22-1]|uniref:type II toxin-antitoxin system RelE/ParE family toxin n=1 Tax=Azospirillum sp. TSO22-1 TaxID=716789 RepID=UPI000D60ED66|nr:type II toxin-antitoxin system RelE/ParE family toxin [Azospirillum sp. TSO22-1]PWC56994.1 hypothetical protein TSO221_00560 [Azospirillum sp. TSO22-1]
MTEVREYLYEDGCSPYQIWFDGLTAQAASLVSKAKTKMALGQYGNIKPLDEGVHEYRIDHGPGYRIYLAWDGDQLIVLFGGGDKSSQSKDIAEAKRLWAEYKRRKAEALKGAKSEQGPKPKPAGTSSKRRK